MCPNYCVSDINIVGLDHKKGDLDLYFSLQRNHHINCFVVLDVWADSIEGHVLEVVV